MALTSGPVGDPEAPGLGTGPSAGLRGFSKSGPEASCQPPNPTCPTGDLSPPYTPAAWIRASLQL